jgi:hypothetical protein
MLPALSAAMSALDALKSLTSSKSTSSQSAAKDPANPFDLSGSAAPSAGPSAPLATSGVSQISPETMSALLAAQSQSSTGSTTATAGNSNPLKDLFSQIDADGDGKLSKTEFENALGAGGTNTAQADDVFSKMDKDGDGSVRQGSPSSQGRRFRRFRPHQGRVKFGSADAGAGRGVLHVGHQQRRLDHDLDDLCRRLQGVDDIGCRRIHFRDIVV